MIAPVSFDFFNLYLITTPSQAHSVVGILETLIFTRFQVDSCENTCFVTK